MTTPLCNHEPYTEGCLACRWWYEDSAPGQNFRARNATADNPPPTVLRPPPALPPAAPAAVPPARTPLPAPAPIRLPCVHLGPPTGETKDCATCGGTKAIPLHACAKHNTCTTDRHLQYRESTPAGVRTVQVAWCRTCADYQPVAPANTVQVVVTADGIGDHLLGLSAVCGLKRDDPARQVVYVVRPGLRPWVELFDGPDRLAASRVAAGKTVSPLSGVPELRPHDTYALQMAEGTRRARWDYYATACGTTAVRPRPRPLPPEAVAWAAPHTASVVLSPWSDWPDRQWLLPNWLELERLLLGRGIRVVVIGRRDHNASAFRGTKVLGESPARVAALLAAAWGVVGNDSGMVHLAGALDTPAVALCGQIPGEQVFGLWPSVRALNGRLPCTGCHWRGPGYTEACKTACASVQAIRPAEVLEAVLAGFPEEARLSLLSPDRLGTLVRLARECAGLPGDYAELGVYRGGSALALTRAAPQKTLHLFDTFAGLPADDPEGPHRQGEFACPLDQVRQVLSGRRVEFYPGRFPATTAGLDDLRFALVHLDGDLGQTTADALAWFWPRLAPGGVLLLDDLHWQRCPGVDRALADAGLLEHVTQTAPLQGVLRKPGEVATA